MDSRLPLQDTLKGLSLGANVDENQDRLIIGLDFGTTYSGLVSNTSAVQSLTRFKHCLCLLQKA